MINLEGENNNNDKTLITFDPSCSNTSNLKYSFYNISTGFCPNLNVESSSISVLFSNCNDKKGEDNSTTWIILAVVLGSIIVIVVTILLIVFLVPDIKNKVFPNRNMNRKDIKERVQKKFDESNYYEV